MACPTGEKNIDNLVACAFYITTNIPVVILHQYLQYKRKVTDFGLYLFLKRLN